MPLLLGPTKPAIEGIRRIREVSVLRRVTVMVAWARTAGVALFLDALGTDISKVRIAVGMAGAGTSAEALSYLRANCAEVYLFHKHHRQTFHPKVYCFENGRRAGAAYLMVGSSNLTGGGLFSNFEANLLVPLAPTPSGWQHEALSSTLAAFDQVSRSPYSELITTDERIQILLEEGYLNTEARLRRRTREDSTGAARAGSRRGKPEAPPPKLVLPDLPPATFEFRDQAPPTQTNPVVPPLPAPIGQPPVPHAGGVPGSVVGDGRFYVRTLTANDVAKILGEQVGTFEPDLGLSARSMFPDFWGWPSKFMPVTRNDTRDEWSAVGIAFSSTKPHGVDVRVLQWFRPARPAVNPGEKNHAAEHRLSIRPKQDFASALPNGFSVTSLVVVERLPEGQGPSFTIRIIAQGEPGYNDYAQYLTQVRQGHRFGYGLTENLE